MGSNINAIEAQFLQSLATAGITPKENLHLILDGKIHRFSTVEDKRGEYSGGYYIHVDGYPNWGVQDFRKHSEMQKFKLDNKDLHDAGVQNIAEMIRVSRENAERRKEEQNAQEREAIEHAKLEHKYPSAVSSYGHEYLKVKHVSPMYYYEFRMKQKIISDKDICKIGDLLIPVLTAETSEFHSLLRISNTPDSTGKFRKSNYKGISITGCCVELIPFACQKTPGGLFEDNVDRIIIVEGIATGLSVLEILGNQYPVLCALSCNNFSAVASIWKQRLNQDWRGKFKNFKIYIAADNDKSGVGVKKANECVESGFVHGVITPPREDGFNGTDWNDYLIFKKGY